LANRRRTGGVGVRGGVGQILVVQLGQGVLLDVRQEGQGPGVVVVLLVVADRLVQAAGRELAVDVVVVVDREPDLLEIVAALWSSPRIVDSGNAV
jgi:hypothetical protein